MCVSKYSAWSLHLIKEHFLLRIPRQFHQNTLYLCDGRTPRTKGHFYLDVRVSLQCIFMHYWFNLYYQLKYQRTTKLSQ